PDRNDRGNQAVRVDHTGRWLVRQLDKERPTPENDEHLHMPHIATCTAATPRPARTASAGGRGRRVLRPAPWQR
ncbi:hypothetical protein HCJ99_34025, partial [Streptomyces sp. C1-2]|nr:hypothetical protein [Streptomyces sp. C1-2]